MRFDSLPVGALLIAGLFYCIAVSFLTAQTAPSVSQIVLRPSTGLPCVVVSPPAPGGPLVCATLTGATLQQNGTNWSLIVSGSQFAYNETPGGMIGGNATFTLAHPPNPPASLWLVRNGLVLTSGTDYNLTGNTITFLTGSLPVVGDVVVAKSYQW